MSQNPDGSVTLEDASIHIRFWTPSPTGINHLGPMMLTGLPMDCKNSESMRNIPLVQGFLGALGTCDHGESMRDIPLVQASLLR